MKTKMKQLIFVLFLFYNSVIFGQTNCAVDFDNQTAKISYNQQEIERIIEPSKYDAFFLGECHTIDFERRNSCVLASWR
jgi:hypothetical protein